MDAFVRLGFALLLGWQVLHFCVSYVLRGRALRDIRAAAKFPRNTLGGNQLKYPHEWVSVPREDFEQLRLALLKHSDIQ